MNRKCPSRRTFFPSWERTKNVLRDTNEFNIDSLMGTKKCLLCFETHVFVQSRVIVDSKMSDRQRRCCAPCRNMTGCKSSFTCHVLLGFCPLSCWVQFKVRSLSFWSWSSAIWHLQPGTALNLQIYVSGVLPQSGFRLHSSFAEIFRQPKWYLLLCYTRLWFKRH